VPSKRRKFRRSPNHREMESKSALERSKKMKMTPTPLCPLFTVKMTDEESIQVGGDKLWIPGFLAFASKFSKWAGDFDITPQLIEEAKSKLAKLESYSKHPSPSTQRSGNGELGKVLSYCFQTDVATSGGTLSKLNKQTFWLSALEDNLSSAFEQSLKLDSPLDVEFSDILHMEQMIDLLYRGILFTFSWNPSLSLALVEAFKKKLRTILHGEDFYSFHPIRLVSGYIWFKDLQTTLKLFVDKFHPSRGIPLNVELAMQAIPSPELRTFGEASVSDQSSAIAQCEGVSGGIFSALYVLHAASYLNVVANSTQQQYLSSIY
jgi:hypothetical protein